MSAPYGRLPVEVLGRDGLKAELKGVLRNHRGKRWREPLVLAGMGGVGKSTVALWLAAEFRRRGRPVWWVNAADPMSLRGGIVEILLRLEAPELLVRHVRDAAPTAADRFWEFLAARPAGSRGALLVFDNADVPEVVAADGRSAPADGAGWVRAEAGICTVVTTRVSDSLVWGGGVRLVPLKVLDDVAAAALLRGLAPQIADPDGLQALGLARRLGTLPLALHLAGTYLSSPWARWHSFGDYRLALDSGQAAQAVAELDAARTDPRAAVSLTWELSLEALAEQGVHEAREVLYLLACFAPTTPIPAALIGMSEESRVAALRGLAELALIDTLPSPAAGGYPDLILHPVLADTCRARMTAPAPGGHSIPETAAELISSAVGALDPELPSDWPEWERLTPHLQALLTWAAPHLDNSVLPSLLRAGRSAGYSLWLIGRKENTDGRPGEELGDTVLAAASRLGDRHPEMIAARHDLGVSLIGKGRFSEAEELFRAVLTDGRSVLGEAHIDALLTRDQLIGAILAQGRYSEAEQMYRDLITDQESALGPEHPQTLTTHVDLAWSVGMQGRAEEAAQICRHALDIDRRVVGEENPKTLDAWADLARWTSEGGSHQEAEDLCTRLLEVENRVLGPGHQLTLVTRATLAHTIAALGRLKEAEQILRDVLTNMETVLTGNDDRILTTRRGLADVLAAQGRTRQAQQIYRQVLHIQQQHLGPAHPETLKTRQRISPHA